jgi:hypothetical protein
MHKRSILGVIFSRLFGFLIFLVLLAVLNALNIENIVLIKIVNFLNNNLMLIVLFSIFLFLGELLSIFVFPFNILYPIFNAVGGVFLLQFIFRIFDSIEISGAMPVLSFLEPGVYTFVILIVLIVGYVRIFMGLIPKREKRYKRKAKSFRDIIDELDELMVRIRKKIFKD